MFCTSMVWIVTANFLVRVAGDIAMARASAYRTKTQGGKFSFTRYGRCEIQKPCLYGCISRE